MKKRYGFQKTVLHLSEEAQKVYDEIDPLTIYENENGLYTITGAIEAENLTEGEVNDALIDFGCESGR